MFFGCLEELHIQYMENIRVLFSRGDKDYSKTTETQN